MPKNYVVIVLGLGEAAPLYRFFVRNWEKKYNLMPVVHVVGWKDKTEQFDTKLRRLQTRVQELVQAGHNVSLIGVSAGASISLTTYARLREQGIHISSYTSVCGRFNMGHHWWYPLSYGVNRIPTFKQSVLTAQQYVPQIQGQNHTPAACFYSVFDEVVPTSASTLEQVPRAMIYAPFHHLGIYSLFMLPKRLVRQLGQQPG